jgi:YhcH/YjgK/YiaL family protein
MIYDRLENIGTYEYLCERMKTASAYLRETDLNGLADGIHEIEEWDVFAFVNTFTTRDKEDALFKIHNTYIDLQVLVYGAESIYYALSADLKPETEYDPEKDILFLSGQTRIVLPFRTCEFYLFYPHDAHMPCCHLDGRQEVKKVVIKIRV